MTNQPVTLQNTINTDFLPYGLDMPYRIIVGNNPVNFTDPLGLGILDCIKCFYYYWQCATKGLECKEEKCEENPDITSDELWRECVQKIPECQKMIEYCGKCALWPPGH